MQVPDCSTAARRPSAVAPGGSEPAFGPADVSPAAADQRSARVSAGRVALRPRAFRAAAGSRLRFTLSAPARVRLTVRTAGGKRAGRVRALAGRSGVNSVRFRARGLRPGRYRLEIAPAGGRPRTTAFRIVR